MSSTLDEPIDACESLPELLGVVSDERRAVLLALDIGTSGVRVALFDELGKEIAGASIRVSFTNQGLADSGGVDADTLLTEIEDALQTFFSTIEYANTGIELVAISCFWHSLVGIDQHNKPTTLVLGWSDTRAAAATGLLKRDLDERTFHNLTGCRFHPSYWPAKLLRLRHDESEVFRRTKRWVSFADYLLLKWCGQIVTSVSMASGSGLMDQRTCAWNSDLAGYLTLDLNSLPEIAISDSASLRLLPEYVLRWPQLDNARIVPAIGDGAANNIGAGCTTLNAAALMIGTSGAVRVAFEGEPPEEVPSELWSYRIDRKQVIVGGALSDGGNVYERLRRTLFADVDHHSLEKELEAMEPDSHDLTILPFWNGERSIGWHASARATITGLTTGTRPLDILRAYMEAVAYRFALISRALDSIAPHALISCSGYALHSSRVWVQILADVLNRELYLSEVSEASTRGAALLALEATGKIESHAAVSVPISLLVTPDATRHARYEAGLERQQKLYEQTFKH